MRFSVVGAVHINTAAVPVGAVAPAPLRTLGVFPTRVSACSVEQDWL